MREPSPRVSLVMPAWNAQRHIAATLRTLFAQTLRDFELIVVDDGSTDATAAIVESFGDPRARVLRRPHAGIAAADAAGLEAAHAPFVVRVDADDLYEPSMLERLVAKADASPNAAAVGCWTRRFGRRQWVDRPPDDPAQIRRRLRHHWVLSQPVLYRADLLRAVGGFMPSRFDDWDVWIRLAERYEIRIVEHVLGHVRSHAASLSATVQTFEARREFLRLRAAGVRRLGVDVVALWKLARAALAVLVYPLERLTARPARRPATGSPEEPTISVVVPTVDRVALLQRCLHGIAAQTRPPDEVVVVHRHDDDASEGFLRAWVADDPARRKTAVVDGPGIVRALAAGTEAATGDVVAYLDDDAIPRPDWLAEIARGFLDPSVGAVGGPIVDHVAGVPIEGSARLVGRVLWYGRIVWGHDKRTEHYGPVDWLTGANMAIRRELIVHDPRLRHSANGLALANDLDTTLAVRRAGKRVFYTPWAVVEHHTTSFRDPVLGSRVAGADIVAASANHAYALLKFIPWPRRIALHLFGYLAGSASIPGPIRVLMELPRSPRRALVLARRVGPTWRGRRLGWRMYREWCEATPESRR